MFFIASKLLWLIGAPSTLLILLAFFGLALTWTSARRFGHFLLVAAVSALLACGFTPLGKMLLYPLEQRFAPLPAFGAAPTGIIVLGGGVDETISARRGTIELTPAGARLTEAMALARRFPQAQLVYTGGSGKLGGGKHTEAEFARQLWLEDGVPAAQMRFEDRSRTTFENAEFTRAMLRPRPGERWILLTSAEHMPRAMGAFRQIGFAVIPDPVDYKTVPPPGLWHPDVPASKNLAYVDQAAHEWIGLLIYRLSGRSNALFPGP